MSTVQLEELLEHRRKVNQDLVKFFGVEEQGNYLIDATSQGWDYYSYGTDRRCFTFDAPEHKEYRDYVNNPRLVRKGDYFVLVGEGKIYLFHTSKRSHHVTLGDYGTSEPLPEEEED